MQCILTKRFVAIVQETTKSSTGAFSSQCVDLSEAVNLFLELLFFENSRPLHSHLLITCIRLPSLPAPPLPPPAGGSPATLEPPPQESERFSWLATRINRLCQEYSEGGPKARRFALVGVTSTLIGAQFQPLLAPVTKLSALVIARELCGYVAYATRNVMSAVMDECQEALSALFFLQREYGDQMLGPGANHVFLTAAGKNTEEIEGVEIRSVGTVSGGNLGRVQEDGMQTGRSQGVDTPMPEGPGGLTPEVSGMEMGNEGEGLQAYRSIVTTVLGVLQSGALTRECDVAASVSLCGAVLLGSDPSDLALELAQAFLSEGDAVSFSSLNDSRRESGANEALEVSPGGPALSDSSPRSLSRLPVNTLVLNPLNSDLRTEFEKCTDFGRLCVLRSLLTTTPRPELNRQLLRQASLTAAEPGSLTPAKPWTLLYDGILPTLCRLCEDATDLYFKFHAITSLQVCLQQVKASLEESLAEIRRRSVEELSEEVKAEGFVRVSGGEDVDADGEEVSEGRSGGGEAREKQIKGGSEETGYRESLVERESDGQGIINKGPVLAGFGESAEREKSGERTGANGEGEGLRSDSSERASMLLTKEALDRVLQIVWNSWEDPMTQTVKQAQVSAEYPPST